MALVRSAEEIQADIARLGGDYDGPDIPVPRLTPRQGQVLDLIVRWFVEQDMAPTGREIAEVLDIDLAAAYRHITALERKGVVTVATNTPRGIRLTATMRGGHRYVPAAPHGLTGYGVFGCRCETCRNANEAEPRDRAERVA
jgi:SOS-response transcriptional repressor LexA